MVKCEECGKKLGIVQRYHHPALGTKFLVCGNCFVKVTDDMERWGKFCLSCNGELTKIDVQDAWNKNILNDPPLQNWFNKLWVKIGS